MASKANVKRAALVLATFVGCASYLPDVPNDAIDVIAWHGSGRLGRHGGRTTTYPKRVRIVRDVEIQGVPCKAGTEARFDPAARILDATVSRAVDYDQLHCDAGFLLRRRYDDEGGYVTRCHAAGDPDARPDDE